MIRNLTLDFTLNFVTASMKKYPILVTSAQLKMNCTYFQEVSKKSFMTNNLQQKLHTEIIKIITIKKVHAMQIHNAVCYMH